MMMIIKLTFFAQVFRHPVAVKALGGGANVNQLREECGRLWPGAGLSETKRTEQKELAYTRGSRPRGYRIRLGKAGSAPDAKGSSGAETTYPTRNPGHNSRPTRETTLDPH